MKTIRILILILLLPSFAYAADEAAQRWAQYESRERME